MELTLMTCIILSIGVTLFVYVDDQFAGFDHKKSRYTRLFLGISLSLWMFANKSTTIISTPTVATQQFNVGISPF